MIKNPSVERYRKEAKRLRALAAATRFADIRERFVLIARDYLSLADVAEAEATYGSAFAAVAGRDAVAPTDRRRARSGSARPPVKTS